MAKIQITDAFGVEVTAVSATPNPLTAALAKYVKGADPGIVLLSDLKNALAQPLISAKQKPLSLGFNFSKPIDFSTSAKPELTIGAGATQKVNVHAKAGDPLFTEDLFDSGLTVSDGEGWLSLALNGTVNLGLSGSSGDLTFGFNAGAGFATEYFRKFALQPTRPTVAEALSSVLSDFILPGDVEDLAAMQPGDISTVSGNGSFKLSGNVTVAVSPNPLATPNLPLVNQSINLNAAASLNVGASFQVSGAYQIRAVRLTGTSVELGYYRKKGSQWSISATASAGAEVAFGQTEFLTKLISALTHEPEADVQQLVKGGLTEDQIQQIQSEIGRGIDHSLKASLDLELSNADTHEAAFLYRIDVKGLDAQSSAAVHAALDGDLSLLTAMEQNDGGHGGIGQGITMIRSVMKNVRDRKSSLKLNLLGLLNFSSVFELIRRGEVVFEPITGDLTINETVSGTRIGILTLPTAQDKLRKIKFDSLLMTSAYRASRSVSTMAINSSDVHFAFNQNTNEHTMSDYLDSLVGLSLINIDLKNQLMESFHGTGASTFLVRVEFGDAACKAMFLNAAGRPRPQSEYEIIGRGAMQVLLLPGDKQDADQYRRKILANDITWEKLKKAGQPAFGDALPDLANDAVRLNVARADYTAVMWWAQSMASTAQKLALVRDFLGDADPATLRGNNTFNSLRNDLQSHVAGVVAQSGLQFGLPFGLVALYQAAGSAAIPSGLIVSEALTRTFTATIGAGA